MPRLEIPDLDDVPEASQPILKGLRSQLGVVPSIFRLLGSDPGVLQGYAGLSEALSHAVGVKTRERIALALAQLNGCDYCLSVHQFIALNIARICPEEIELNRQARSSDAKADAAVKFATAVLKAHGRVSDEEISAVRGAGFGDPEIVALVAVVASNLLTNFVSAVAQPEIDFPVMR